MKHRHSFLAAGSSYGFYAMGHCSRIVPMNLLDLIILIPNFLHQNMIWTHPNQHQILSWYLISDSDSDVTSHFWIYIITKCLKLCKYTNLDQSYWWNLIKSLPISKSFFRRYLATVLGRGAMQGRNKTCLAFIVTTKKIEEGHPTKIVTYAMRQFSVFSIFLGGL